MRSTFPSACYLTIKPVRFFLFCCAIWLSCFPALGEIWGLNSHYPGGAVASSLPTYLYSFEEDGSSTNWGSLRLQSAQVDADALACSDRYGLLAFTLTNITGSTTSTLVAIDSSTATATPIGGPISGEMRGAVFTPRGELLVVDSDNNRLLEIAPLTGEIIRSVPITGVAASNVADLAIGHDGTLYLASLYDLYRLNPETGQASQIRNYANYALVGLSFSPTDPNLMYGSEVNGFDEIYKVPFSGSLQFYISENSLGFHNNSGRGDLARLIVQVPEPTSGLLLLVILWRLSGRGNRGQKKRPFRIAMIELATGAQGD